MLIETGKDGYDADAEFDDRTSYVLNGPKSATAGKWKGNLLDYDAKTTKAFVEQDWPHIRKLIEKRKKYRVLDIGCGYGRLAPILSQFDCAEYRGVERCAGRVGWADGHHKNKVCMFVKADAREYRAPARFDLVLLSTVIQHLVLPDKQVVVAGALSALRPDGILVLREARIFDKTPEECEALYADPQCAPHMIPTPLALLAEWVAPLQLEKVRGTLWFAR